MPTVSVLLTCYNHLRFLPACLESALSQTFGDLEVFALDDGSTDGTREWLQQRAADDPRVRLHFNESNMGTYATLNRGLKEASGEFVAILNDDDLWEPQKIERQLEWFAKSPRLGLVHTDGAFIDGNGQVLEGSPLGFEFPRTETGDVLPALLHANKIIASATLVKRECFEQLGGFDEAYFGSGDWQMWLRIAEVYDVGFVPEKLTYYRVHGGNASHKLERIWRDDERLREWIRDRYPVYETRIADPAVRARAFAHNEACLGTVKTLNGDPAGGRDAYRRSLRFAPGRFKSRLRWLATFLPRAIFRRLV